MKYILTATQDATGMLGNFSYSVKPGDKTPEVDAGLRDALLLTEKFDRESIEEVPQSELEKERFEAAAAKRELAKLTVPQLHEKAEDLSLDTEGMRKADIVEAVSEAMPAHKTTTKGKK